MAHRHLLLSACRIDSMGIIALAEAMEPNVTPLRELDLYGNPVGPAHGA